jgi:hypothetical protein
MTVSRSRDTRRVIDDGVTRKPADWVAWTFRIVISILLGFAYVTRYGFDAVPAITGIRHF